MVTIFTNILILLFFLQADIELDESDPDDFYTIGLEYINKGNWQDALNLWIEVRDSLRAIGKSDFRIGRKFIEFTTTEELTHLYPLASEFYLWGLQPQDVNKIKNELLEEIEMLEPIIPEDIYTRWKNMATRDDLAVLSEIKGFWIEVNPVIDTAVNERLIEHWERIAYARKHFTRTKTTVYHTDDRGSIYIKMGEPDRIESGNFLQNNNTIQFIAREILRQQHEQVDGFGQDRISTQNQSFGERVSESYYLNNVSKAITDRVLTQRISNNFEVWVYENQTVDLPENLLFIFGTDANSGQYGLVSSPVDFIPLSAFRLQRIRDANLHFNTGAILQLSLYDDLKFVDDKFLDIYNDLFDRLMSDESIITESSTSYLMHRYSDELEAMRNAAPKQLSVYDRTLETFPIQTKTYRFFNDNLEPFHLLVASSTPHEIIIQDNSRFRNAFEHLEPRYHLKHSLVVHDSNWSRLQSLHDFPVISFDSDDITLQFLPSTSMFRLPGIDDDLHLKIYGSIINESLDEVQYGDKTDNFLVPDYIIGSGNVELPKSQLEHDLNPVEFEVSDLVLGYRSDFELENDLFIPFYIPAENILNTQVDLHFLFEVYNISRGADGFHNFQAEYQVVPQQTRSRISRLFTGSDPTYERITLYFESEDSISKNHISVDISEYRPGDYTLRLIITDEETEKQVIREEEFTILE